MERKTVYKFAICYEGDWEAGFSPQHRYVVAGTEEDATEKLERYNTEMQKLGYAPFEIIGYPVVDADWVLI